MLARNFVLNSIIAIPRHKLRVKRMLFTANFHKFYRFEQQQKYLSRNELSPLVRRAPNCPRCFSPGWTVTKGMFNAFVNWTRLSSFLEQFHFSSGGAGTNPCDTTKNTYIVHGDDTTRAICAMKRADTYQWTTVTYIYRKWDVFTLCASLRCRELLPWKQFADKSEH